MLSNSKVIIHINKNNHTNTLSCLVFNMTHHTLEKSLLIFNSHGFPIY